MNTVHRLLEETPEAYYWMGLLLADGCFYAERSITLSASEKHLAHMQSFAQFVGSSEPSVKKVCSRSYHTDKKIYVASVQNSEIVPQIMRKFRIKSRKTYNPPDNPYFPENDDLFYSLFLGQIDGDGSVSKSKYFMVIGLHPSWFHYLEALRSRLEQAGMDNTGRVWISNSGYAHYRLSTINNLILLKKKALSLGLPILHDKWEPIDIDRVNPNRSQSENDILYAQYLNLRKPRCTQASIASTLGITRAALIHIIESRKNLAS